MLISKNILKTLMVGAFVISMAGFTSQSFATVDQASAGKQMRPLIAAVDANDADKSNTKIAHGSRRPEDRRCHDRHRKCGY